MTKDEILAYLQDAVRNSKIYDSVYQTVREWIRDSMPDSGDPIANIEIARYPIMCAKCHKSDEVHVMVDGSFNGDCMSPGTRMMLTYRIAPEGWKWRFTKESDGVEWLCPKCAQRASGGADDDN